MPDFPSEYKDSATFEVAVSHARGTQPDSATVCVSAPRFRECRNILPGEGASLHFSVPHTPGAQVRIDVQPPEGYRNELSSPRFHSLDQLASINYGEVTFDFHLVPLSRLLPEHRP